MITLQETENGNLKIILNDKEELETILERASNTDAIVTDLLDGSGYLGNDWHEPQSIGLTEAPAIAFGAIYNDTENDNVEAEDYEKIWYFPFYMLHSFAEILLEKGEVEFQAIHQTTPNENDGAKLVKIIKDKGEYYRMVIEHNGVTFESNTLLTIPNISKAFGISIGELLKIAK